MLFVIECLNQIDFLLLSPGSVKAGISLPESTTTANWEQQNWHIEISAKCIQAGMYSIDLFYLRDNVPERVKLRQ